MRRRPRPDDQPSRPPRARRTWSQRAALGAGVLSAVVLAGSAAGLAYVYRMYEQLPRVELTGVLDEPVGEGEPGNYLIVGVDDASDLDPDDPVRVGRDDIERTDTIMILRVQPGEEEASLLSLPRDLWIPVPGTNTHQRINTMIQRGGPQLLVRAIDEYLGIPVNHYVQVDFAAFRGLVEAVDGVPVYFPHPARDRNSGLEPQNAGCVTLDATQALAYVRSRYYEEQIDGEWVKDATSDVGRIERQQDFIRRALSRAYDRGARNPGTLRKLVDVGIDGVTADDDLTAEDLFDLGNHFRSFDPADLTTYSVPATDDVVGGAEVLRLDEAAAEETLALFRSPSGAEEISPSSVRLRVENGSGASGQATEAADQFAQAGFGVEGIGDAASFDSARTVVEHGPGQRDAADAVSRWIDGGAELREVDEAGIVVVTGTDWQGLRDEPVPVTTTEVDASGDDETGAGPSDGGSDGAGAGEDDATTGDDADENGDGEAGEPDDTQGTAGDESPTSTPASSDPPPPAC